MTTQMAILIVAAIVVVVGVFWFVSQRRKSDGLRERFGPEYERTVHQLGGQREAESELEARRKRVEGLDIHPLDADTQARFAERWRTTQGHFVDDPNAAIAEADHLVGELMRTRGYPTGDFEQRAADISVDHPNVVTNYRAAHRIAESNEQGRADTENLRTAMVHYRALFEELLETPVNGNPVNVTDIREGERHARAS